MGKLSRDKGARFEREVVARHLAAGIEAERVPLSGAAGGSYMGDVIVAGKLRGECKRIGTGLAKLHAAIEQSAADMVFIRQDRGDLLVVLPWETWQTLAPLVAAALPEKEAA